MIEFILVRHGQSTANLAKKIAVNDTPLTELGVEQARETANAVRDLNINTIASSPYLRAQQTAETIAGELGIDLAHIKIIDELAERDLGELKGNPKTYESKKYYTLNGEYNMEPHVDIIERMNKCLEKLTRLIPKKGRLLVVGHAVSGYYLIEIAEGRKSLEEFEPPQEIMNADFVIVKISENRREL